MTEYKLNSLKNHQRDARRLRKLVYNMNKPDNFTYMDISTLVSLLDKLDEYISCDISNISVKENTLK